jgi:hypothetical protein
MSEKGWVITVLDGTAGGNICQDIGLSRNLEHLERPSCQEATKLFLLSTKQWVCLWITFHTTVLPIWQCTSFLRMTVSWLKPVVRILIWLSYVGGLSVRMVLYAWHTVVQYDICVSSQQRRQRIYSNSLYSNIACLDYIFIKVGINLLLKSWQKGLRFRPPA